MTGPTDRISVQLYSVRHAIGEDIRSALARIADIGYANVEPYGFVGRAQEYARLLRTHGLSAPSAHAPLHLDSIDEVLEAAEQLGVTTLVEPMIPAQHWSTREAVDVSAARLNALVPRAAQRGIRLGYHNHAWELQQRFCDRSALEVFADLLDPSIVLEIDAFWASAAREDPVALIERLGDRVGMVHVKDGEATGDKATQKPAGQGRLPVDAVIATAPRTALLVTEFDEYAGDVFEGLAESLDYVRAAVS